MNQFKDGDVMYHPYYGMVCVQDGAAVNEAIRIKGKGYIASSLLSYKPWPAPVHERPLLEGFYIANELDNEHPIIVKVMGDGLLFVEGRKTCRKAYELVHYLGTKIPHIL